VREIVRERGKEIARGDRERERERERIYIYILKKRLIIKRT
jgi:hypothetical protein